MSVDVRPELTSPSPAPTGRRARTTPRLPQPPRRPPSVPRDRVPLTDRQRTVRGMLIIAAILLLTFVGNLTVMSHLQHVAHQQKLHDEFVQLLADGTAPVSEGDFAGVLLRDGAPVSVIEIPDIGVSEVVSEGTSSGVLMQGPGHRRDTVLPGQQGVSVVMGRAASFGGPFARLQELMPGAQVRMITGQGDHVYEVLGVRYAGDPAPAALVAGEGRLILESARGAAFAPTGVVRVDARLVTDANPPGARQTTFASLPVSHAEMATDTSSAWALVFGVQVLILVELALVWTVRRIGVRQAWAVFVPVAIVTGLVVTDQIIRLLPNLL